MRLARDYDYNEVLSSIVLIAQRLASLQSKWAEMKAVGCDEILKTAGSTVTIDKIDSLSSCSTAIFQAANILKAMDNPDLENTLFPRIDAFVSWLCELTPITDYRPFELHIAHSLAAALQRIPFFEITNTPRLLVSLESLNPRVKATFGQKILQIEEAAFGVFKSEYDVAKRAIPKDPARLYLACHCLGDTFRFPSKGHPQTGTWWKESKAALKASKKFLPPLYFKTATHDLLLMQPYVEGMEIKEEDGEVMGFKIEDGELERRKPKFYEALEAHCATCNALGKETSLKCCSRCNRVWYCNADCQKADWKQHKKVCMKSAEKAAG